MTDTARRSAVDELLDRAIVALNSGDVARAHQLADQVLQAESGNAEAGDLLAAQVRPDGEIRRLTVMFCDLVGSTELSERLEPETYHAVLARYQELCRSVVEDRYDGSIVSFRGDGILASFGFPSAHEDDVDRAVLAGLDLQADLQALASAVIAEGGDGLSVRVAVHKGVVFLDRKAKDLYGFAVNVAARLESLAAAGTVLISEDVRRLLGDRFALDEHEPRTVKGVASPLKTFTVLGHRGRASRRGSPLIGRQAEVDVLLAAWRDAVDGTRLPGECVAIVGEAGIGKSRLATALRDRAADDDAVVVELDGSPLHTDHGLWVIKALVDARCGATRQTAGDDRLRRLVELVGAQGLGADAVPLLAALVGIDPAAGYEPVEADARRLRDMIGEASLAFVESCVGGRPALLLCEDLHWFDEESRDLVAMLTRRDHPHLSVVVTTRDLSRVPRGDRARSVVLEPFGDVDRIELVRSLAGDRLTADVVLDVAAKSDGIPLYLEELVRARLESPAAIGSIDPGGGILPDLPAVPEVLYEPLVARLQQTANGTAVVAAAATMGRDVDREVLSLVTDLGAAEIDAAMDGLIDAAIIEASDAPGRFRFRHELLRAVAYDLQPPSQRRELHGRVADALVGDVSHGDAIDWAVVAAHYEMARRAAEAADAFEQAADVARRRGALFEARSLLGRAIEVIAADGNDRPAREAALRLRRGFLAVSLEGNSSAEAAADYERCLDLLLGSPASDELIATMFALWSYFSVRAEFDRADELMDALERTTWAESELARFLFASGRALVALYRGDLRAAAAQAEEAVARTAAFDGAAGYEHLWFIPIDPACSAHGELAIVRMLSGDISGSYLQFAATRDISAGLPFPQNAFTLAGHLSFEVWLRIEVGDLDAAEVALAELADLATRHGFDQWSIVATTQREILEGLRRAGGDAEEDRLAVSRHAFALGGYLNMWKMVEQWVFVPCYQTFQGALHAAAGETEAAIAALEDALAISAATGMRFYEVETLRHRANLRTDPAERIAGLLEAIELAQHQGTTLFELRAAMDLNDATGDLDPVRTAVAKFAPDAVNPTLEAARTLVSDP